MITRKAKRIIRGSTYKLLKIQAEDKCEICKTADAEVRHHPNYKDPSNVRLLCRKCHGLVHKLAGDFKNRKFIPPSSNDL